jgi:hypothetical protein
LVAAKASSTDVAAPSNASALALSDTRIDVTWQDDSPNETRFDVYRSTGGETGTFTLVAWVDANATVFNDQGLQGGTQYCYRVRAIRMVGSKPFYSAFSNTTCATTAPPVPPPPYAASGTAAAARDSATVNVTWYDNSWNEDGFRVYRSADGGVNWVLAGTTADVAFVDTDVPNAELGICYRVVAFNAGGDAAPSTAACTTPPAAPTNLTVIPLGDGSLDLTWTDNSAVEDVYQVWAEIGWGPTCTGGGACDAVVYTYDFIVAELPANSRSYHCTSCAGAVLWVVAKKGEAVASTDWWWP